MVINDQDLGERMGSKPVKIYAEFGRRRGGLLYVLQALVLLGQGAAARLAPGLLPPFLTPLAFLPLYVAYFIARDPVWNHLYRSHGYLDEVSALTQARREVWWTLAVSLVVSTWSCASGAAVLAGLAWTVTFWAILAVRGRLPVDNLVFIFTFLLALGGFPRLFGIVVWEYIAIPAACSVFGIYEHFLFVRAARQGQARP